MPDLLIRDVDEETVERLKLHARNHGRSLQAEVAARLKEFAQHPTREETEEMFRSLRERFAGRQFPSAVDLVREGRDR
ncbi:MAG: hypothetical protein RLY86_4481 [Pseudomonadota bacterium]|jgi:plasmid stability protein